MTIWILEGDNSPDLKAFSDFEKAFANYREHIDERTSGMDWDDDEFEWGDSEYNGLKVLSCHCYGEFVARLHEVEVQ